MREQSVYFHGMPGSADELRLFEPPFCTARAALYVLPRSLSDGAEPSRYWESLASALVDRFPNQTLRFIGFSLGAAAALRLAAILGQRVCQINLISPAAPLELGDYLSAMAGAPVFKMAQASPRAFALMTAAQAQAARLAPRLLARMLFASAQGADRHLFQQAAFRACIAEVLKQSIGRNSATYQHEIRQYVETWSTALQHVTQPVTIDHGSEDNWSPVAMAHDLASTLPNCARLTIHHGHSHYSALQRFLSQPSS